VPFTFSHPAAALPLRRLLGRFACLSALAIGSIAPDLSFIVPVGVARAQTHGLAGLILYCLPAGLLTYLVFHQLLKLPLLRLFSLPLQEKLVLPATLPRAPWSAVCVSLLCGALTHIVWDAFTHPGTPVVQAIGVLDLTLASVGGYKVHVYSVLQHASSIAGLLLLAWWAWKWQVSAPRAPAPGKPLPEAARLSALAAIVLIPLLCGAVLAFHHHGMPASLGKLQGAVATFIFTALPALAATVCAYCVGATVIART
jgi:hypothetical protein